MTLLSAATVATPAEAQTRLGVLVESAERRAEIERAVTGALLALAANAEWVAPDAVRGAWGFVAPSPGVTPTDALAQSLRARVRLTTLFVIQTRSQGSGPVALAVHAYESRPAPESEFASVPASQAPARAGELAVRIWTRLRGTSAPASASTASASTAAGSTPTTNTTAGSSTTTDGATGTTTTTTTTVAPRTVTPRRAGFGFAVGPGSTLTARQVNRALGGARPAILACGANLAAGHRLEVSVQVGANGRVQSSSTRAIEGAQVPRVNACILRSVRALRFPAASGSSEVRLRLTFVARPPSRPPPTAAAAAATPAGLGSGARITIVNEQSRTRWIFVDGNRVATLQQGERHTVEVAPGTHRVVSSESADPNDHPLIHMMTVELRSHHQWRLSGSTGPEMQRHSPVLYPDR